jgi:hypothetical protein
MPVTVESPDLREMLRTLQAASKDAPKAFKLALNASRRVAKKDSAVQSAKVYNVGEKRIEKDLKLKPIDGFEFVIIGQKGRRPPSLLQYGAEQNAQGLVVSVIKSRGRRLIKSGFIATSPNGNRLPFIRFGPKRIMKKGRYEGKLRQPLFALYGPSVADMLINNEVYNPIHDRFIGLVSEELTKRISRAIKRG